MKRTYLRHCMLHACSVGRVREAPSVGREWIIDSTVSTYTQMARAVNWLWEMCLVGQDDDVVVPVEDGASVLYRWDAKYGPVSGGQHG